MADREHITDGRPCWCRHRVAVLCPSCEGEPEAFGPPCWRCGGEGLLDADGAEDDRPRITIHDNTAEAPPDPG